MNRLRLVILFSFTLSISLTSLFSQDLPSDQNQLIQDIIENLDIDGELDYNTIYEQLLIWLDRPFNINEGDPYELVDQFLISDLQAQAISEHIRRHGELLTLYELQSIDLLDIQAIQRLRPFIATTGDIADYNVPIGQMLTSGDNEFFARWSRVLETQKGYTPAPDSLTSRYLGDPNRLYLRFRHTYENRMSFGFTAEKDSGEPFFKGVNKNGFDFYSGHFYLKGYRKWLKEVAIGDYSLSLGQGLIFYGGFALGKSSLVNNLKRSQPAIRPFRSVNEADFLRGAAVTLGFGDDVELTLFSSFRKRDGNISTDTVEIDDVLFSISRGFTSLIASGLHRTPSEIENKNQIDNTTLGARLQYRAGRFRTNLNVVHNRLSQPFERFDRLYNLYRFRGDRLTNVSVDYEYTLRNFHFFGETGYSDNGRVASVNGLLLGLDRNVRASVFVRSLPADFHTLISNTFGETNQGNNEHGVYFGLEVSPHTRWTFRGYYDIWRHPWLRFNVDAPSSGHEQLMRVDYNVKRKFNAHVQFRREVKQRNQPSNETAIDFLALQQRYQVRFQITSQLPGGIQLRNRVEISRFRLDQQPVKKGYLIYQDIIFKPLSSPLSLSARIALFDTDGYDARIYAYENDVIYSFFIPAYFDRGVRYYLNLRYKGIRNLTAEFRIARTEVTNRETLSSGLNEINDNHRTELKAQVIYRFN